MAHFDRSNRSRSTWVLGRIPGSPVAVPCPCSNGAVMKSSVVHRPLATLVFFCVALTGSLAAASASSRPIDPAQVVPLDKIAPQHREAVSEVIRDHTFHRKGEPETFPCHPRI